MGELNMEIIWIIILVGTAVLEAITVGLTSIWFSCGALVALIAALFGAEIWLQVVLFIIVAGAALTFTRPLAKKYLDTKRKATNADRVLDMVGVVTEEIDNVLYTGTVSVGGKMWSARSATGEIIKKDTLVRPMKIDGVKLIVVPVRETAEVK